MRSVFLLGGFLGFVVVAASGLQAGRSGDRVLFDASLGCLASAVIFRWFWSRLVVALCETVKIKREARRAAEEAHAAAKATPVGAAKIR